MSKSTVETGLQVTTAFKVDRHPGLTIAWSVGSAQLHLIRVGGPKGSFKMRTKSHASYKTSEGAIAGASRWFAQLDTVYEPQSAD